MLSISVLWPAFGSEVMTVTDPAERNRLMGLASSEGVALAAPDGCVDRLHRDHAARAGLASLGASSPPAGLRARRDAIGKGDVQ